MFPFYLQYLKYDILLLTGNKHHFLVISLSSLSFSVSLCYAAKELQQACVPTLLAPKLLYQQQQLVCGISQRLVLIFFKLLGHSRTSSTT